MRHVRCIFCVENEIEDQMGDAKGEELFRDVFLYKWNWQWKR